MKCDHSECEGECDHHARSHVTVLTLPRYPRYAKIRVGDIIRFTHGKASVYKQVAGVHTYNDFRTMLKTEGVTHCLPHVHSVDEGEKIYHQIQGYRQMAKV